MDLNTESLWNLCGKQLQGPPCKSTLIKITLKLSRSFQKPAGIEDLCQLITGGIKVKFYIAILLLVVLTQAGCRAEAKKGEPMKEKKWLVDLSRA